MLPLPGGSIEFLAKQGALALHILKFLLPAVPVTIGITLASFALALVLGCIVGILPVFRNKWLTGISRVYVDTLRGVPLLVQIFFIYFGLGKVLDLGQFAAGVTAVGICYSAYLAEIFRAGVLSIAHGQHEAAAALGMSPLQAMRHVILPQATRTIIPPAANEFIACLKDSSLVSIIGLREVTRAGREYYSQFFVDFQTWLLVGLIYLAMTLALTRLTRSLERRFAVKGFGTGGLRH
ncbi:MAG: amino acid ABC transporter permease [candidate division Zixibacteria bacterium]|nr:amino acid ABC transporter permease [candidate division Zixibacteria bacterium]